MLPRADHQAGQCARTLAAGEGLATSGPVSQYRGPLGHTFRKMAKRKNRNVAVVACARKLAVLVWQLLSSGEPFRYGEPRSLRAKFSRLRVRATGRRRRVGMRGNGAIKRIEDRQEMLDERFGAAMALLMAFAVDALAIIIEIGLQADERGGPHRGYSNTRVGGEYEKPVDRS